MDRQRYGLLLRAARRVSIKTVLWIWPSDCNRCVTITWPLERDSLLPYLTDSPTMDDGLFDRDGSTTDDGSLIDENRRRALSCLAIKPLIAAAIIS